MNALMIAAKPLTVPTRDVGLVLGISRQAIYKRAEREHWRYIEQGNARLWVLDSLPPDLQSRLSVQNQERADGCLDFDYAYFKSATEKSREKAKLRASFLGSLVTSGMTVQEFCLAFNTGSINRALLAKLGPVSYPTAYRWQQEATKSGPAGLVPRYRSTKGQSRTIDTHMQCLLIGWYCTRNKLSVEHCWRLLQAQPEYCNQQISYDSVRRYINSLPEPYVNYARLGKHKADARYQPYIDGNPELYLPMAKVYSDHHVWDFLVEREGNVFRPWITVFQDARSAKLLGWCPSIYPSSLSIAVAFFRMVSEYGSAELIHIDNGKDYRSVFVNGSTQTMRVVNEAGIEEEQLVEIQGIFALCGSAVTFAHAYHGQSKGRVERLFGSLEEYIGKSFETYVGSNTVSRHEETALYYRSIMGMAKQPVMITWEIYCQVMESAFTWWNAEWRGDGKALNGRTPDEAFADSRGPMRRVDPEILSLAFSTPEVRTVQRNGIRMDGTWFWSKELFEFLGHQVIARRQLHAPDTIIVCHADGRILCTATANYFAESGDLSQDIRKVETAKTENKAKVIEFAKQAKHPETGRSIVDRALAEYPRPHLVMPTPQTKPTPTHDDLPLASGGDVTPRTATSSRLINPLDLPLNMNMENQ